MTDITIPRALPEQALGQLRCNTDNMRKGMSKSIQKLCARENVEVMDALRTALAQPQQDDDPSGHFLDFTYVDSVAQVYVYDQFAKGEPFYKRRKWVSLTEEEVNNFIAAVWGPGVTPADFIRAVEAKLKEKNHE